MQAVMARIRITIDTEDVYKRAFLAAAATAGMTATEFFEHLVKQNCADDVKRAQKAIDGSGSGTKEKKPKE